MTEAEWVSCPDLIRLVVFIDEGKASPRKLSLFSCACFRHIWHLLTEESRETIQALERMGRGHMGLWFGSEWEQVKAVAQEDGAVFRNLLHDIIGNPFRPVTINPAWLTPTAKALAQAAYEERALPSGELDLTRLKVLADALEEAGCTEQSILDHLRGPGPHTRGCWPVDLVLARE
jgi:hypothetical protein